MHLWPSSEAVFALLGASLMKMTVVMGLAWIAASAAKKQSAAFRHLLWSLGVVTALLLPGLTLLLPEWQTSALRNASGVLHAAHSAGAVSNTPTLLSIAINVGGSSPVFRGIASWLEIGWLAGALIVLLRLAIGIQRAAGLSRKARPVAGESWDRLLAETSRGLGIRRKVRIRICQDGAAMPVTWGVMRPLILLPATASLWSRERRSVVLRHEMAHISRGDWGWQMLAELARAIYWFHPLAWLGARRLRQESECACDDLVLNSGIEPAAYAEELLELARTLRSPKPGWATALALTQGSHLERRFTAMLNRSTNHAGLSRKARMAAVAFALCMLVPFAAFRLTAQGAGGKLSGIVYDPSGAPVSNATVIVTNSKANTVDMTTSGAQGEYRFGELPTGEYEVRVMKPGFAALILPQVAIEMGRAATQNATLKMGVVTENVDVVAEGRSSEESKTPRVRLGGEVQAPKVVNKVQPTYPASAKEKGSQGTVVLHAIIGMNGSPLSLRVLNSDIDPDLARSAVEAVSKWRYSPTLLNGQPIEVDTTISVNYTLAP
jgi:TonB family protein